MSAGRHSSAAPAFDPMEADDDFLDEETTKVKELPVSDFPDAAATVVSKDVSPFVRERQLTPVVPAVAPSRSPLEDAVPDLFDEDDVDDIDTSADDMIDPRLLDPAAAAVPPPAGGVSDAGPVAAAVFDVPKAAPAVEDPIRVSRKKKTRGWLAVLLLMLLVFAAAVAALRLGLLDDVLDRWLPELSLPESLAAVPPLGAAAVQVTPGADVAVPTGSDEAPQAPSATPAAAQDAPVEAQPEAAQPITADMIALRVLSVPSGAFVSINGKAAGRTPLVVEHAAGTELSIFSKARGFLARREKIVVQAGQDALKLVLSPLPFVIEVVTDPPGANITVAGVGSAITPAKVELTSFTQSLDVEISKPGHETVRKSVARKSFVEEPRRMVAKINAKLTPVGTPAQAQAPAAEEPVAEAAPETAEPAEPPATEIPADAAP